MSTTITNTHQAFDSSQSAAAFKVANNILSKWNCSVAQKEALLGMKKSAMYNKLGDAEEKKPIRLERDQLDRVSYILNIHQALAMVFSNNENVYGFVNMPNQNPYFNGKTPLEIMAAGSLPSLYEVYNRIDALRRGGW